MSTGPINYGPITEGLLRKALVGWVWEAKGWGSERRSGWSLTKEAAERGRDAALASMKPRADETVESLRQFHRENARRKRRALRQLN